MEVANSPCPSRERSFESLHDEEAHDPLHEEWVESSQCSMQGALGCTSLSQSEKDWVSKELLQHQSDAIGKWIVKKPKSLKHKLPRRDKDENLLLKKWCCNATKECHCKAEL
eukprot:scaffold596_cov293-Pavlova_lutheri.AAC.1